MRRECTTAPHLQLQPPWQRTDRTPDEVRKFIAAGLACEHVEVEGDGRHFFATIVAAEFEGRSRVARHQRVYAALGDRMREQIHALSMKTLTPAEWQQPAARLTPNRFTTTTDPARGARLRVAVGGVRQQRTSTGLPQRVRPPPNGRRSWTSFSSAVAAACKARCRSPAPRTPRCPS